MDFPFVDCRLFRHSKSWDCSRRDPCFCPDWSGCRECKQNNGIYCISFCPFSIICICVRMFWIILVWTPCLIGLYQGFLVPLVDSRVARCTVCICPRDLKGCISVDVKTLLVNLPTIELGGIACHFYVTSAEFVSMTAKGLLHCQMIRICDVFSPDVFCMFVGHSFHFLAGKTCPANPSWAFKQFILCSMRTALLGWCCPSLSTAQCVFLVCSWSSSANPITFGDGVFGDSQLAC